MIYKKLHLVLIGILLSLAGYAQEKTMNSVRVSGIVVDADDHEAVPYVNISVLGTMYGSAADNNGYFSLFMNPGDTLLFSSVGYRDAVFIMPYELTSDQYSLVQLMRKETVQLEELVVFPWPTVEQLEEAFLELDPESEVDQLITEVQRNLETMVDKSLRSEYYYDQMRYNKLYELHGKVPPNNFLNPFQWAEFLRDVRNGTLIDENED